MRVIAVALALAACGGQDPAAPDAAPDAGPALVDFEWIVDLPSTQVVDKVLAVPGGAVYIGDPEIIRLDDDGNVRMTKPLPDPFEYWGAQVASNGDILIHFTGKAGETLGDCLGRFDLQTLDPIWIWCYTGNFSELAVTATEDGAIAVIRPSNGGERELHHIDGTGASVSQLVPGFLPYGIGCPLWPVGDGSLFCIARGDQLYRWILWPETGEASLELLDASKPELKASVVSNGHLLASWGDYEGRWKLIGYDAAGNVVIPLTEVPREIVGSAQMALTSAHLWRGGSKTVYRTPLDDLESYVVEELPTRPGGSIADSTLHGGDGDRVFVAWFDQVATFDQILRIGRVALPE